MRIPGMEDGQNGGWAVQNIPVEVYTALERGAIDATEWVGPYDDELGSMKSLLFITTLMVGPGPSFSSSTLTVECTARRLQSRLYGSVPVC